MTGKKCRLCAVVKCDAYGHSVDIVLPALNEAGVDMLAVAAIEEAEQLKSMECRLPILLMGSEFSIYRGNEKKDIAHWLVENEIRVTAMNVVDVEILASAAQQLGKKAIFHVLLDTGMSRMGLDEQNLLALISKIRGNKHIQIEGLYTHFAAADENDKSFSNYQLQKFKSFAQCLSNDGLNIPILHAANSAAAIDLPESHLDMIRAGISLYGYYPSGRIHNKPQLKPAMKVVSFLTAIKKITAGSFIGYGCTHKASADMIVGIVPIGYGDGYDRRLSNRGQMRVSGHFVPVVGRVSMDQTIVDLSKLASSGLTVVPGDEVTVIDNVREAPNSVKSLATELDTIPYEIVTRLGPRIQRVPV